MDRLNRSRRDSAHSHTSTSGWDALTPADLAKTMVTRMPSVLTTAAIVTVVIAGLLWSMPNQYISDGMFYARLGRGALTIDPTADASQVVSLQDSRSSEVASISEMLSSREVADRVVRRIGAREINFPRTWIDRLGNRIGQWTQSAVPASTDDPVSGMDRTEYDRQLAHEAAVRKVTNAVTIAVPKNSYTVSVSANYSDPLVAQKVVQAYMDEYGAYHVEAHQSTGSLDFFEQQTSLSHATAVDARKKLQTTKNEMGWMSAASAEASLRERILNLELSLDQTNSELAESKSKAESLTARLTSIEEWIPMEVTKVANNAVDGMRTQLYGYKIQDGEELSKVTASHPRYKILKDKIDQGEEMVDSAQADREQTVEGRNPLRMSLESDLQTAKTTAAGYASRRDSLTSSLAQAREELRRLNQDAVVLAELNWAADIAETNYLSHSKSLESSRMMQELDNEIMSDVSVIQQASLNLKKVGPPRFLLTIVGGILGVCFGMLQALLRSGPQTVATTNAAQPSQLDLPEKRPKASRKLSTSQLDSDSEFGRGGDLEDAVDEEFAIARPR
ncbi:Chromosome partition protein Smc [Rubripirellula lacrimiformis]|uniref:Chromosome partition protein Smc n=1 Tax=Rubripirellula lacrimiformis TaxID=1930273 RepID=A0A517N6V1_9BACT|nr:exopolysaccharide biosynthesis protein [Rubripirellula lacrimiformis]QDT02873.1 Chromosome partition protein Smc [Rubripirellula lacrimiformis]